MSYQVIECGTEEAWLKQRMVGLGASDAAAVLGVSPWLSPSELWGLKTGLMDPTEDNERFRWGRRLEDDIIDAYVHETDRLVIPNTTYQISRSTKTPFMLASLDGEIAPVDDRGPGIFEGKTAAIFKKDEWADGPPLQYLCQIQHSMAVRGVSWGSLAVLFGTYQFFWLDVERNDNFIEYLVKKETAFWNLVTQETPPPLDGSEGAIELLKRLYPKPEPGKVVELPNEFIVIDQEFQEIKANLKKLEDREKELKNQICAAIGGAEVGVLPSGDSYRWGHIKKEIPAHDAYTQEYRQLTRRNKKASK